MAEGIYHDIETSGVGWKLIALHCLQGGMDTYAWLFHEEDQNRTLLIDAPEPDIIADYVEERGWGIDEIWITHHHWDHIDGVDPLRRRFGAVVTGNPADAERLPSLDRKAWPGQHVLFGLYQAEVIATPGHTNAHISYYFPEPGLLFSGDALMALGCGRLFEGTPQQMWDSLLRLRALPDATLVASGHEIAEANAGFCLKIDPNNRALKERALKITEARKGGKPTLPVPLGVEKETNPFLRVDDPTLAEALHMPQMNPVELFAEIRAQKDRS